MATRKEDFQRYFNKDFWRAFSNRTFPIHVPSNGEDKFTIIDKVYHDIESARYSPSIPETEMLINKGYGVTRTVPVFRIEDYIVYYYCIRELEDVLSGNRTNNTFGGWSLGGKLRAKETCDIECEATDYGRYSFNPRAWVHAFGEFNSLLYAQLDTGLYSHVLQFDLSNFYDSIRLDMLERSIREADHSDKGWVITLLFYFLNNWNRRNTGLHRQAVGLPQDALADCSRLLANFYLQKYDSFASRVCAKAGGEYFRYADDQMVLLNDVSRCDGILLLLTKKLDRFGLRVNQKKVDIWTTQELKEYRCRDIHMIFSTNEDRKDPALVEKFAQSYLGISVQRLAKTWNGGMPLLNRLIWANIESLPEPILATLMSHFLNTKYMIMADSKKFKRIGEIIKSRQLDIDFRARLIELSNETVHNAFHHEVFAYATSVQDRELAGIVQARLIRLNELMLGDEIC